MIDQTRLMFIHGLAGSSQGFKATLLRRLFPHMIIPDFLGQVPERMAQLRQIVGTTTGWTLIGSSLGGLMATACALERPDQVRRLVLLAPALPWLPMEPNEARLAMPTTIYHGQHDDVVPLEQTQDIAKRLFDDLTFVVVEDDHGLGQTVQKLNWRALLEG